VTSIYLSMLVASMVAGAFIGGMIFGRTLVKGGEVQLQERTRAREYEIIAPPAGGEEENG
jgi:hypothetical protein